MNNKFATFYRDMAIPQKPSDDNQEPADLGSLGLEDGQMNIRNSLFQSVINSAHEHLELD